MAGMKFCPPDLKTLAFYRHFNRFSGGHLKVWDYFNHTKASGICEPVIYMTPDSLLDVSNPWVANGATVSNNWMPNEVDALFIGGMDWLAVPEVYNKPVINLVQHIRHALPEDPRYTFLHRRATRICVSQQVADAIVSTGQVNGPVVTISNGLNLANLPVPAKNRDIPALIAGYKEPNFAESLFNLLNSIGIKSLCLTRQLPRPEYLSLVARSSVTVFLPNRIQGEGFYLPAIEGMALGSFVVCPDCVGNRDFCLNEVNCLQPTYDLGSIVASCQDALVRISNGSAESILSAAFHQVHQHSIEEERRLFLRVLSALLRSNSD
jgi:glycosyltransferase involved in cell wall biosynthesis